MSYYSFLSGILITPDGPLSRLVVLHQRPGVSELVRQAHRRFVNICVTGSTLSNKRISERKLTLAAHFSQLWNERTNVFPRRIDLCYAHLRRKCGRIPKGTLTFLLCVYGLKILK